MKKLLTGFVFILAVLGLGLTVANEMDLFDEQDEPESRQYDSDDLYQNETASYPGQYSESDEYEEDEDDDYDDDEYDDDSDQDDLQ
ncbi:hypothetical protein [Endozoicomonas numazuensis]|nr:hypothetical protein [Endozoicomonas numazuensis]